MLFFIFFFFNDTATTEIYTLSLHDALPICARDARLRLEAEVAGRVLRDQDPDDVGAEAGPHKLAEPLENRSEEHTSELQSQSNLVCRLLLEKKKKRSEEQTQRVH